MGAPQPARTPLAPGGHGISAGCQLEEPAEVILDHRARTTGPLSNPSIRSSTGMDGN